jgi:hypothetical protein
MTKMEDTPHHVLDFLLDDEDSCALTIYTEDNMRMHIIADVNKLKDNAKSSSTKTYDSYAKLVDAFRSSSDEERVDSGVEQTTKGKDSGEPPKLDTWSSPPTDFEEPSTAHSG